MELLRLFQSSYVQKVLTNYGMPYSNVKAETTLIAAHFKLSTNDSPKNEAEKIDMEKIPYGNVVGSLMYLMVYTMPCIGYAVSLVSRYMANLGKSHCEALKWIFRHLKFSLLQKI